jgi:hypothetical protein
VARRARRSPSALLRAGLESAGMVTCGRHGSKDVEAVAEPQPASVAFATTELFTPSSARSAMIAESTSQATTFLGVVSGGRVALGLVATASHVGAAFYAFAPEPPSHCGIPSWSTEIACRPSCSP